MNFLCCKISRKKRNNFSYKKVTLLVLGLDNAGKSTIIRRLTKSTLDDVLPTVGFAVSDLQYKGCNVTLYDVGGGAKIRGIWKQYYADAHGLIFVIDSKDTDRMDECRQILTEVLSDPKMSRKPLLLLANKQDLDGALDEIDVVDRLCLENLVNQQKCPTLVELCAAAVAPAEKDLGIRNGFKWLLRNISKDYPILNNRVLVDMASQEESERQAFNAKKNRADEEVESSILAIDSGEETQRSLVEPSDILAKPEVIESCEATLTPVDCEVEIGTVHHITNSQLFFKSEDWSSTAELLTDISTNNTRNWFKRPKSSGAIEFPIKKKKRRKKRLRLHVSNKTAPAPMVEFSQPNAGPLPAIFDPSYTTDVTVLTTNIGDEDKLLQPNPQPRTLREEPKDSHKKFETCVDNSKDLTYHVSTVENAANKSGESKTVHKSIVKNEMRNGKSSIPVPVRNGTKKNATQMRSDEVLLDVQNLSL